MTTRASGSITRACPRRAASAAASSPCRPASSASRSSRRRSTTPATAFARSGRLPRISNALGGNPLRSARAVKLAVRTGSRANQHRARAKERCKGRRMTMFGCSTVAACVAGMLYLAPHRTGSVRRSKARPSWRPSRSRRPSPNRPEDARGHAQGRRRPGVQLRGGRRGEEPRPGEDRATWSPRPTRKRSCTGEEGRQGGRGDGRRRPARPHPARSRRARSGSRPR